MFGLTRSDLAYAITHVLWFVAAYATCMAGHPGTSLFNWECLSSGLIATGATATGTLINRNPQPDPNNTNNETKHT